MCDPTDEPRKQPDDPDLAFADGELDDDDPDVIAGMARLDNLRSTESSVTDFS